ncbi:ras-related protein Rab-44 [Elgaria multicarinata webbii]|uniref:ras-related protein Rab-44 n=1 Tax=Elgaria multicarinata webbii TaxID=159646 RepID=UPI002FCD58C9
MDKQRCLAKDGKFGSSRWKQARRAQGKAEVYSSSKEEPFHSGIIEKVWDICREHDEDKKGFIARADMQKLAADLPWSTKELELVFDGLDDDNKGYLTAEEFTEGLRHFLSSQTMVREHRKRKRAPARAPANLLLAEANIEEQKCFEAFINQLGPDSIFEDKSENWKMWFQLLQDEPHLLGNLKEFLANMTHLIKEAKHAKEKLQLMLKMRVADHNKEVQQLQEEMEQQIEREKQRLQYEGKTRNQLLSTEMKKALDVKEQEIQHFLSVQKEPPWHVLGFCSTVTKRNSIQGTNSECAAELETQFLSLKEKQQVANTETQQLKQTNSVLENQLQQTLRQLQKTQKQLDTMKARVSQMHKQGGDKSLEEDSEKNPQRPQDPLPTNKMVNSQLEISLECSLGEDTLDSSAQQAPDNEALMANADSQSRKRVISIEEDPLPGAIEEEQHFPQKTSGQSSLFKELHEAIAALSKSESRKQQIDDFGFQGQESLGHNGNSQQGIMPGEVPQNEAPSKNGGPQKGISETLTSLATSQAEILLKEGPAHVQASALKKKKANIFEPGMEVKTPKRIHEESCVPGVQSPGYSALATQVSNDKEDPLQGDTLLSEQVIQPENIKPVLKHSDIIRTPWPSADSEQEVIKQSLVMKTPDRKMPETRRPPMKDMASAHFPLRIALPKLPVGHKPKISLFQNSQLENIPEIEIQAQTTDGRGVLSLEDRTEEWADRSECEKNQQGRAEMGEETKAKWEDCQGNAGTKETLKGTTAVCPQPDHVYNVLFVGDSYVGKTSFLHRFQDDSFSANMIATVGMDYRLKNLFVDNKCFALRLWDTAGQER